MKTLKIKLYPTKEQEINTLREKAKVLAKNDKILFISIDKVEEIIKDTRSDKFKEYVEKL